MRLTKRAAVLFGLTLLASMAPRVAAEAQSPMPLSSPGSFWKLWGASAKANFIAASGLTGGAAQRVTIAPKPEKPWDAGIFVQSNQPVRKGDTVLLTFWARVFKTPPGGDLILLSGNIYETGESGISVSPQARFLIGKQWKLYQVSGTTTKDYPAGALTAGLLLGTGEQVIDFGPVTLIDLGQERGVQMSHK